MEALILSCGTGGGHNSAGRAVAEELQSRGHRVTFIDPYQLAGQHTSFLIDNTYIRLVQKSPKTFGALYAMGEMYRHLPIHSPVYCANKKMAVYVREFLEKNHFDVVIMSHMYPAHILTHLRKQGVPLPQAILIATDYTCIPFMEEAVCDYYVIPAEDLSEEFCSRGIPQNKILPFGIPVSKEFSKAVSKSEIKQQLGLNTKGPHILLSGGSIGAGKIEEATYVLHRYLDQNPDASLTVICGNNIRLFQSLQTTFVHQPQVCVLQKTERMSDYVHACDMFISKPGGLSSTEAAVAGIPLIHISPIPGCETKNVHYFVNRGMSLYVKCAKNELQPALECLKQESAIEGMLQAQKRYLCGRAAEKLCDFLESSQGSQL